MKGYEAHGIAQEIFAKRASYADIERLAKWAEKVAPALDELFRNAERTSELSDPNKMWMIQSWDLNYLLNLLERQSEKRG